MSTSEGGPGEDPMARAQILSRPVLPKRFYENVTVCETQEGFGVALDGRPVRTPARRAVAVPAAALAECLANEWRAQKEEIDPKTMPATRLINSAIDGVADRIEEVRAEIVRFAGSDLVCYRAERPEGLVERQNTAWDPVLVWAEAAYGARFDLAGGLMPIEQSPETLAVVGRTLDDLGALQTAALFEMTSITGSALIALRVAAGAMDLDAAWTAAHVDEDWNIEEWGEDDDAKARRAYRLAEMETAAMVYRLASG